jgi:hypothetical protein
MFQKVKTWRSSKYLEWVRAQNCAVSNSPPQVCGIDAHHINSGGLGGGTGIKICDVFTIPVTRQSHQNLHAQSGTIDQQRAALLTIEKALNEGVLIVNPNFKI